MPLSVGDKLGHYEVLSLLGKGGMGEVYRARDPKLKRDVALKVLPEAFARNPERMARFQREAEVLASLNHPNIAAIYGVEDHALVMEFVEGESPKGPLPFDDAWHIASQIAAALQYAHDKGVMHRDLKPANVKVTPEGTVKLLDFGLAKAFTNQREVPASVGEDSPTLTIGATEAGVILGTAAYMAPEQARGKSVDKRADIWSFGVVLYELLTGERLFTGEDSAEVLAAVIHKQPDFTKAPQEARRLLEECLQKDPKQRLRDIGDATRLVGEAAAATASSPSQPGRMGPLGWITAGAMAVLAAVGLAGWYRATRPAEQPLKPLVRFEVDLGADPPGGLGSGWVILSPDGSRLVYGAKGRLFTRRMDEVEAMELPDTEGALAPFFSPDGQWIAFGAHGKLKKISVDGGAPIALCDATSVLGGSWGEDGSIIANLNALSPAGLSRIPSSGGAPTPVTELAKGEGGHRNPQILPDGKGVLFTVQIGREDANRVEVVSVADRRRKVLIQGGTNGRYMATANGSGYLIYYQSQGTLSAVPFDLQTLEVRGTPVPVLERVAYNPAVAYAWFDVSRTGTLVYRSGGAGQGNNVIQWLDAAGNTQPLLAKPAVYSRPHLSPDGQRLAFELGSNVDIWTYDWRRDAMSRVISGNGEPKYPVWSPDSRYIVFGTLGGGMFWTRADGAGRPQPLTQWKTLQLPTAFAPDGKRLAFTENDPQTGFDLWTLPIENDSTGLRPGKPEVFLATPFAEIQGSFSPDGKWLAYYSDESGTFEVYVRAFPDNGGKWQVSNSGGVYPAWSRNGRELFYRTQDNQLMAVNYTAKGDSFVADKPRVWSGKRLANIGQFMNYDPAPDGKRIAAILPAEGSGAQAAQGHAIFLLNFFDELQRKVPANK